MSPGGLNSVAGALGLGLPADFERVGVVVLGVDPAVVPVPAVEAAGDGACGDADLVPALSAPCPVLVEPLQPDKAMSSVALRGARYLRWHMSAPVVGPCPPR
jgi:hypothetical protein